MKTQRALFVGLAFTAAAITAHAQSSADFSDTGTLNTREDSRKVLNFKRVEMNYLVNLNSAIPGVVESALGHVTLMRIAYPDQDFRKIQEKLYDLASQGATRSIRHKAFTAMQVFANPTAFKATIVGKQNNGDGLLEDLAEQL
jgi:hypothetical protein